MERMFYGFEWIYWMNIFEKIDLNFSCLFRTQPNIYCSAFLRKCLTSFSHTISRKSNNKVNQGHQSYLVWSYDFTNSTGKVSQSGIIYIGLTDHDQFIIAQVRHLYPNLINIKCYLVNVKYSEDKFLVFLF